MANIDKFCKWLSTPLDSDGAYARFKEEAAWHSWCKPETMEILNYITSECLDGDESYLEIGTFMGTSLIAALKDNDVRAYVIDPLSDVTAIGTTYDLWRKALVKFGIQDRVTLYRVPCESLNESTLPKIGLYYYDGNHDSGHTYEGLKKFEKTLSDHSIIMVDCYNIIGGHSQRVFPGHNLDINHPVKTDVDRWLSETPNATLETITPWWHGQAIITYRRQR